MNRSILIVICDFLLVSLLAFSTVDINKAGQTGTPQMKLSPTAPSAGTNITGRQDLGDVMRLALDEERKNRDQLVGELTRTRSLVNQQDQQIQSVQTQLETKAQLAARLEQERVNLQNQYAAAQTNLANLNDQLHATTAETILSKEQTTAMEAEARNQADKAAELEKQLAQLQKSNQSLLTDQQTLHNQLQLSEASNHFTVAQMTQLQREVEVERQENVRLADGVKVLAAKSSELAHEIRDNRPLTPNMIFEQLSSNRVTADFTGQKSGVFGASSKESQAQLILVTDETNIYALSHVQDTPLIFWKAGTQWQQLDGALSHGLVSFPITSLSFSFLDPRIVFVPVPASQARSLGCQIYHFSKDPYVFQDAVVVGTRQNYYGECKFQIDMTTPRYLKMDHNSLKGLFGKFNPSSGDLVLSKTGQLLGVMANDSYCAIIRNFEPEATLQFGVASKNQQTAETLSALFAFVSGLPFKLQ